MIRHHDFPERYHNRAEGNLTYLEFIALVKKMWEDSHPDIRLRPTQGPAFVQGNRDDETFFPVIVYGLQTRQTFTSDPKMHVREQVRKTESGEIFIISGQRFENIVAFTVLDTNPLRADEVIEAFEDFMLEYTPVFKRLGASEFMYARRTPDNEATEAGEDLARRTVTYRLVTEKIRVASADILDKVIIDARIWLDNNQTAFVQDENSATPITAVITDLYASTPPEE